MPTPPAIEIGGRAFDLSHRGLVVGVAADDAGAVEQAARGADVVEVAEAWIDRVARLAVATDRPILVAVSSLAAARAALEGGAAGVHLLVDAPDAAAWVGERGAALLVAAGPGPGTGVGCVVDLVGPPDLAAAPSLVRRGRVVGVDDGTAAAGGEALDAHALGRLVGLHVAAAVMGVPVVRTTQVRAARRTLDVLAAVTSARRARLGP